MVDNKRVLQVVFKALDKVNQLFPEGTMYLNHKSITKKTLNYYVHYYVPFQKVIYYVIN